MPRNIQLSSASHVVMTVWCIFNFIESASRLLVPYVSVSRRTVQAT